MDHLNLTWGTLKESEFALTFYIFFVENSASFPKHVSVLRLDHWFGCTDAPKLKFTFFRPIFPNFPIFNLNFEASVQPNRYRYRRSENCFGQLAEFSTKKI